MAEDKELKKVLDSLETVSLVMPFLIQTVSIIRGAMARGGPTVSLEELQDAWQANLDKVDTTGREWLKAHGFELPPPKPPGE